MASHRTYTASGFTLIEILMVLGILGVLGGVALFMSMDTYRAFSFHNERDTLVGALEKARAQAVAGVCFEDTCSAPLPHGLHVGHGMSTIFEGPSYSALDPANEDIAWSNGTTAVSGATDIVFEPLSGDAETPGSILITDDSGHTSTIEVNTEGRIAWSN